MNAYKTYIDTTNRTPVRLREVATIADAFDILQDASGRLYYSEIFDGTHDAHRIPRDDIDSATEWVQGMADSR